MINFIYLMGNGKSACGDHEYFNPHLSFYVKISFIIYLLNMKSLKKRIKHLKPFKYILLFTYAIQDNYNSQKCTIYHKNGMADSEGYQLVNINFMDENEDKPMLARVFTGSCPNNCQTPFLR